MEYAVRPVRELVKRGWGRGDIDRLPTPAAIHGVRVVGGSSLADSRDARIEDALAAAPSDGVLSGWAAASRLGVPEQFLDGTTDGATVLNVDFSVDRVVGRFVRSGLRIRRSLVPVADRVEVDGALMTSPQRTALDLARWARWEPKALAMLDMCCRHELIDRDSFVDYLRPLKRMHGLKLVRATAPMITTRAESPPESELRYLWSTLSLPLPVANPQVFDRFGHFVARIDLLDPVSGFGAEYQGFWHRLDGAREADEARLGRLSRMNLTIVPVWKSDMASGAVSDMLLRGYQQACSRNRQLDAWTCRDHETA